MYRTGTNSRYRGRGNSSNARGRGNGRQTSRLRGLFADSVWHCDCAPRLPAEHFKVKKEGKNQGRWFYTCQQSDNGCGFFLWDDDAKPREEAVVLSGKRTEPKRQSVQEGWNAGRPLGEELELEQPIRGSGLFGGHLTGAPRQEDDASTASPSPPPSYSFQASGATGVKRSARDAEMDDEDFGLDAIGDQDMARAASALQPETPHKAQKTGVYATPATTVKRRLPWQEEPTTPATTSKPRDDYFDTPSKRPTQPHVAFTEPETPAAPPTLATAASPSPPTRYKDALQNPADSSSSLTSEILAALSSASVSAEIREKFRSICTKHDLRYQGVVKGRDISRLAMKAKDAKITELQARIASLEAEREVERSLSRMKRWKSEKD